MRWWGVVCLLLTVTTVVAQHPDNDAEVYYYPYAEPEERAVEPFSDSTLFYRAIRQRADLYEVNSRYALPRVTIYRRGVNYAAERSNLYGAEVTYQHTSLLRLLGAEERARSGAEMAWRGGGFGNQYRFTDDLPLRPYRLSVRYAERNYRLGAQFAFEQENRHGWQTALAADVRTGRDALIEGVFTNALQVGGRMTKRWGEEQTLTMLFSLPLSMRGVRSASTDEAFHLTDNPYYNPSWGFQNGKVRNARVRRSCLPLLVAHWQKGLSEQTTLAVTLGAEMGLQRQSALGWYDARTPQPDNYRNMPSYTGDLESESVWRENNTRYTQIAWDEMIAQNRLGDGAAIYALEDRVARQTHADARIAFVSRLGLTELDYGLSLRYRRTRSYKEMNDLLGSEYLLDIDQYLVDDDTYSNRLQNDLRHPGRLIGEGDRFGYDYALVDNTCSGWLRASWRREQWSAEVVGAFGKAMAFRQGFYEKELFAGSASYGKSRKIKGNTYSLKGLFGYSISPRTYLEGAVAHGAEMPAVEDLFVQPLYNNRRVDAMDLAQVTTAQLLFRRTGEQLDWQVAAYLHLRRNELQTRRNFDDLAGVYSDVMVSGLDSRTMGVEAALQYRMAYRWTLTASASWCDARYVDDASVTVLSDVDNSPIDTRAVSHLRDCRPGGVPALTATAAVRYYGPRGWGFRISAGLAAGRYVDAVPLRRTDRVAHQAGSTEESFMAFTRQEQLDDAFTVDASLYKTIYFQNDSQLWVTLHLSNLTACEVPSYGYESMRSQRYGTATATMRMPQATRYLYGAPRALMLTVGYRF